jgi:hypothetical protein
MQHRVVWPVGVMFPEIGAEASQPDGGVGVPMSRAGGE